MTCDHCREAVVDGVFCTRCGAHQGTTDDRRDGRRRTHSYLPHPGDPVAHPGLFTTLFPHLGQHKVHEFRWALLAGLAGLGVLWVAGFVTAAILVAAFLAPVLYLIYLYEAQVYRDEPAAVVGFTIGAGALFGVLLTLAARLFSGPTPGGGVAGALGAAPQVDVLLLVGFGILFPAVQELLKPLPALLLRSSAFPETMDGLAFGVAAGVGFSTAESLVNFSAFIGSANLQTPAGGWILPLLTVGVLQPVMQGSCTGALAASLWRLGRRRAGWREAAGGVGAVAGHVLFAGGSQVLSVVGPGPIAVLAWQGAVVVALLVLVRYLVHFALLEEAADLGLAEAVCGNCHMHVMAAGFCPTCGMALDAAPRSVREHHGSRRRPRRAAASLERR